MRLSDLGHRRLSARTWLLLTAVCTVLPHAPYLPSWVLALAAALILWQALRVHAGARGGDDEVVRMGANRWALLLLSVVAAIGVRLEFGHFFGKDPGIAILTVLLCLKQLEVRGSRDVRAAVLLAFFLQLGLFLNDQTMGVAALALTGMLFATTTLLALHDRRASAGAQLRTGGVLVLQALPFLVIFFIAFPRVQGPLWGLPADAFSATTGLSDSMSPGSISNLIESSAIAFRADFTDTPPPSHLRYWRGPVLSQFDGRTWRPLPFELRPQPEYVASGDIYTYTLALEPHNKRWLLGLDYPVPALETLSYTSDLQLFADAPVRTRRRIVISAAPDSRVGLNESDQVLRANLELPRNSNPRTLALVDTLVSALAAPEQRVARIIEHFRTEPFIYTLRPPRMDNHSVDAFLFDARRGFCEHFASAFVFMARAAGVPARVVTGYQGGEINPVDGLLIVRQSDAHAWAEVWLSGRGWMRVDPTAAANPLRVDFGIARALPDGELLPFMMRPALQWLRDLRHRWEAVSNYWDAWVLGFNPDRQRDLFTRLGFEAADWRTYLSVLGPALAALLLALLGWAFVKEHNRDPLDRAWQRLNTKLARRGLARHSWEGPIDYADRIGRVDPRHAERLRNIATAYARLRYGPQCEDHAERLRALNQQIRKLDRK